MFELKKVDVWSVAKVVFVLSFLFGLGVGFFYLVFLMFVSSFAGTMGGEFESQVLRLGGMAGFFVIFFVAIFISVFYTVSGVIFAALYNLLSKWTGGLRLNLVEEGVEKGSLTNE